MKDHRVRLRDDEIALIAAGMELLYKVMDEGDYDHKTKRLIVALRFRFREWGTKETWQERPFYSRRERDQ